MISRQAILAAVCFAILGAAGASLTPAEAAVRAPAFGPLRASPDAKAKALVYVSEFYTSTIDIFDQKGRGQTRIGTLTTGVSFPGGLFVDSDGNLWVANETSVGTGYILEFAPGATTPTHTIQQPSGYALATKLWRRSDGTLYVVDVTTYGGGYVLEYVPSTQTWTYLLDTNLIFETGIVGDSEGNVYAAGLNAQGAEVDVLKSGSSQWENTNISVPYETGELAIDAKGNLVVADPFTQTIQTFKHGSGQAINTIACPGGCTDIALDRSGTRIWNVVASTEPTVQEFTYPAGRLLDTVNVTQGSEPFGIAASPSLYP